MLFLINIYARAKISSIIHTNSTSHGKWTDFDITLDIIVDLAGIINSGSIEAAFVGNRCTQRDLR